MSDHEFRAPWNGCGPRVRTSFLPTKKVQHLHLWPLFLEPWDVGPQIILLVHGHGTCPAVDPSPLLVSSFQNTDLAAHLQETLFQLPITSDKGHAAWRGRQVHLSLSPRALCVPLPATLGPCLGFYNVVGTLGPARVCWQSPTHPPRPRPDVISLWGSFLYSFPSCRRRA